MYICLIETNACGHSLESSRALQTLKHPIFIFPWSGVGGPLRKTKRKEAGESAGGKRRWRSGQFSSPHPGGIWEHVSPSLLAPGNPNARNAGSHRHRAFPEGTAGDWAGGLEPGSGTGPQGLCKAESRWVLCSRPPGLKEEWLP